MTYIEGGTKNLILVRGVSGSGKTTFVEEFIENVSLSIATDDFFILDGIYTFDRNYLAEYHQRCIDSVESEMETPSTEGWCNIVVHNTFTGQWEMQPYLDLAEKYGYNVYTIIIENRHKSESIHGVPKNAIKAQRDRFEIVL
mgnify:CR=1 FL=1